MGTCLHSSTKSRMKAENRKCSIFSVSWVQNLGGQEAWCCWVPRCGETECVRMAFSTWPFLPNSRGTLLLSLRGHVSSRLASWPSPSTTSLSDYRPWREDLSTTRGEHVLVLSDLLGYCLLFFEGGMLLLLLLSLSSSSWKLLIRSLYVSPFRAALPLLNKSGSPSSLRSKQSSEGRRKQHFSLVVPYSAHAPDKRNFRVLPILRDLHTSRDSYVCLLQPLLVPLPRPCALLRPPCRGTVIVSTP